MITVIHTADIHFGMENYGSIDSKTGIHSRLLDFEKALNYCIDYAINIDADLFLFCGDAYKTAQPSPTQQKLFLRCLLRLYQTKIPIVIIIGNHDNPLSFGKANSLEIFNEIPIDGFYVIDTPQLITIQTKNGPIQIIGIPWPSRTTLSLNTKHLHSHAHEITDYITSAVNILIQNFAQKTNTEIPSIFASHLTVASGVFSGSEKRAIYGSDPTFLPSQLAIKPFDYVALGHLHRYQSLNKNGYPDVVYSGSIERIDFGERKEPKGFCVVKVIREKTTHAFIEIPTRPFIQIECKLDENNDNQTQQIRDEINRYIINNAIIKILYHIPIGQKDRVDLNAIERHCSHAHYIVGIIPIHQITTRDRRIGIDIKMDLAQLLTTYFEQKPELQKRKNILLQKALDTFIIATNTIEEDQT